MDSITSAEAQLPVRAKGQSFCPRHNHDVTLVCLTCSELVCVKCITHVHKGHAFGDLQEAAALKKVVIQDQVSRKLDDLCTLKQEIRVLECSLPKDEHNQTDVGTTIEKHLEEKQAICFNLEKDIERCKGLLQAGTSIDIYDSCIDTMSLKTDGTGSDSKACLYSGCNDSDIAGESDSDNIADNHATASKRCEELNDINDILDIDNTYTDKNNPCGTHTKETNDSIHTLESTKIFGTAGFNAPERTSIVYDIAAATDNSAWVCCVSSKFVTHFDINGTVLEVVGFDEHVNTVSVSPTTGNLWAGSGRSIYEISASKVKVRFCVTRSQKCICLLVNEHIAIGMVEKVCEVSVVSADGERKLSTKVRNIPDKISECPITRNIAVLLVSSTNVSFTSIVIMDKLLFSLKEISLKEAGFDRTMASCVSYDIDGALVVEAITWTSCRYNTAILLNGNGHYLCTLAKSKGKMSGCKRAVNSTSKTGSYWRVSHDAPESPQKIQLLKCYTI